MKADKKRKSGFYWVRFEGQVIVAEYTCDGLGCSPEGPHWHVPQADECFKDRQVCELLSERLELRPSNHPELRAALTSAQQVIDEEYAIAKRSFLPSPTEEERDVLDNFERVLGEIHTAIRQSEARA